MPIMAEWQGKTFEVSPQRLTALEGFSSGLKAKTKNNNDAEGSSPTQNKGLEHQTVDFSTVLADVAGVDVRREFDEWLALVGKSGPLYLGGQLFGPDMVELLSVKMSDTIIDPMGRIRSAKLAFSFKEDAEEAAAQKGRVGSYVSVGGSSGASAVSITPSTSDKLIKKLFSI